MSLMSGIREMENILQCAICMDSFKDPKMLQCQHSFCAECLYKLYQDWYNENGTHKIQCPFCRVSYPLKPPWFGKLTFENFVTQLPNNFMALSMMDVKEKLSAKMTNRTTTFKIKNEFSSLPSLYATATNFVNFQNPCQCSRPTTWWCHTCSTCLCNECISDHYEVNQTHEIFNIEPSEGSVTNDLKQMEDNISSNCLCQNNGSWNCKTCDANLCNDCFQDHVNVYNAHEIFEIRTVSLDNRVNDLLREFEELCANLLDV